MLLYSSKTALKRSWYRRFFLEKKNRLETAFFRNFYGWAPFQPWSRIRKHSSARIEERPSPLPTQQNFGDRCSARHHLRNEWSRVLLDTVHFVVPALLLVSVSLPLNELESAKTAENVCQ